MEFNKLKHVPSVTEIKQVAEQLKGVISETPLEFSASLSARYGAKIYLKREDLQVVRSYKIRGAYHKISNIPSELRSKGVVAASAGNHAQGVGREVQPQARQEGMVTALRRSRQDGYRGPG